MAYAEYPASYPSEANKSLSAAKGYLCRLLPGNRTIKDDECWIEVLETDNLGRFVWEIKLSDSMRSEVELRKADLKKKLSPYGVQALNAVEAFRQNHPGMEWGAVPADPNQNIYEVNVSDWDEGVSGQPVGECSYADVKLFQLILR